MSQRLPIGLQDFVKIREDGFLYVDKTARIHELLTGSGGVHFLSRPRRFGKSLLCSTLGAIFEGRRELFSGLAIDSLEWDWKKYPVLKIDLNPGNYEPGVDNLYTQINIALKICAEKYGVPFEGENITDRFIWLILNLSKIYSEKLVIILDEYDKPLLSTIDNPDLHKKIRSELKGFYGVLKSYDQYLQFVLLTGVTKFARVSIFSDLNNLRDISMDPRYNDLCGITQEELERDFAKEIQQVVQSKNTEPGTYLAKLKRFYNGYRFSENPLTVYNPFGLLNHFDLNGLFQAYWYETGTPTFLIKLINEQKIDILDIENKTVSRDEFKRYDVENMKAVPVLYQSGYLTIVDYKEGDEEEEDDEFTLDYPNTEVRASFAKSLLGQYESISSTDLRSLAVKLPKALRRGDIEAAMNALKPFFAEIPYDLAIKKEKYYQTIVHLVFRILGLYSQSEVKIASGRIDTLVETKNFVYCFEFKLNGSGTADEALAQIDSKDYLLPWQGRGKKLFKVGVEFNYENHTIKDWKAAVRD